MTWDGQLSADQRTLFDIQAVMPAKAGIHVCFLKR